jgi:hypothetical protein
MTNLNDLPTGPDGSDYSHLTPDVVNRLISETVSTVSEEDIQNAVANLEAAR